METDSHRAKWIGAASAFGFTKLFCELFSFMLTHDWSPALWARQLSWIIGVSSPLPVFCIGIMAFSHFILKNGIKSSFIIALVVFGIPHFGQYYSSYSDDMGMMHRQAQVLALMSTVSIMMFAIGCYFLTKKIIEKTMEGKRCEEQPKTIDSSYRSYRVVPITPEEREVWDRRKKELLEEENVKMAKKLMPFLFAFNAILLVFLLCFPKARVPLVIVSLAIALFGAGFVILLFVLLMLAMHKTLKFIRGKNE